MAPLTSRLTTVDFMHHYVDRNRERNGHYAHVEFLQADVTELELPGCQYDVIFSNWLLMYLSDDEVATLTRKMLGWLKDDGYLFVRESCFHPSGKSFICSYNCTGIAPNAFICCTCTRCIHYLRTAEFVSKYRQTSCC